MIQEFQHFPALDGKKGTRSLSQNMPVSATYIDTNNAHLLSRTAM
jgi:hypothetical protein